MKAWIISDMHVTHADMTAEIDIPQADICVCAGDVSGFLAFGLEFLKRRIANDSGRRGAWEPRLLR